MERREGFLFFIPPVPAQTSGKPKPEVARERIVIVLRPDGWRERWLNNLSAGAEPIIPFRRRRREGTAVGKLNEHIAL